MRTKDLKIFIESAMHYFRQVSKDEAVVETPYLRHAESAVYEYCGVIGISGNHRGSIYFSAPRTLLEELLTEDGEEEHTEELLCDLVGEITNTLSANVRRELGKEFIISVPEVLSSPSKRIKLPTERAFVVPITWRKMQSMLIIALE